MARCSYCGQKNLTLDDNWTGKYVIRDTDTQLPHKCLYDTSISFSNVLTENSIIDFDSDWLCEDHAMPLNGWHCPVKGCTTRSRIRRRYYNELSSRKNIHFEN